jgi:hypothetical protein
MLAYLGVFPLLERSLQLKLNMSLALTAINLPVAAIYATVSFHGT